MVSSRLLSGPQARRVIAAILGVLFLGLPLYALPEEPAEPAPQELTLEQILERYYEALGGDRYRAVQSMKTTGTSVVASMGEAPYALYAKRPDKMLLEIYVPGMTGQQAYDGETAWWYMPFMGHAAPHAMPPDMAHAVMEGASFDGPLVDAAGKGHSVELQGIEPVNGDDAYKLHVTLATGGVQIHYLDVETFYTSRVVAAGQDTTFLDYRLIDGYPVPHKLEIMGEMGEQIVYVDTVEFDVPLEDSLFEMR